MDNGTILGQIWNVIIGLAGTAIVGYMRSISNRLKSLEIENAEQDKSLALARQKAEEFERQLNTHTDDMKEIREKVNKIESAIAQMSAQIQAIHQAVVK